jgi:hypothetical protein
MVWPMLTMATDQFSRYNLSGRSSEGRRERDRSKKRIKEMCLFLQETLLILEDLEK